MKIVLDYKKGWFGRFRKLKIYLDGDIHLTDMKQGERTEVEIPENIESICGGVDLGRTERIKIQELSEGDCIEMVPFFTFDRKKNLGLTALPIRMMIKNKDGFQK